MKEVEEAYNIIAEEVRSIEHAHVNAWHGHTWKLINKLSGMRTSQRGQIDLID